MEYESIWDGRESLFDTIERDYAAMVGDGWELIYVPPSPLTTPWDKAAPFARPDPDAFTPSTFARKSKRRRTSAAIDKDWTRIYIGRIHHVSRGHR